MKKYLFSIGTTVIVLAFCGCKETRHATTQLPDANSGSGRKVFATATPQWSDLLKRDKGWVGADGIYCVPMNGVEKAGNADTTATLFWFSDSVFGAVDGDSLKGDWEIAHNAVAYLQGGKPDAGNMQFYEHRDKEGKIASVFEPQTPNTQKGDYYWLGDGFFNHATDSTIYIFAYRIKNVEGGIYPFDDVGLSLIAIPKGDKPPFTKQRQLDVPFFLKDSKGRGKVVFGSCVMPNTVGAHAPNPDGFIYVYGVRGPFKDLLVARVPDKDFENFTAWRFWDGKDWSADVNDAAALTNRVSNEMSVSFMEDGRVMAVYQLDTNSPDIMFQVGKTPWGPFQPAKKIWDVPEIYDGLDMYTYNAKAHPHLSKPGELLISYNINSFNFDRDIIKYPHHLRPRFITLKYQ